MKAVGSYPNVRLRRNRKNEWSRRLVSENNLSTNDLIWPIFIREGKNIKEPIKSMPGVYRYSLDKIEKLVETAISKKIPMIALFPYISSSKKNAKGTEALNKNNLICKALRLCGVTVKRIDHPTRHKITLARWLKLNIKERTPGRIFLISAGYHWQLVSGRKYVCGILKEIVSIINDLF